MEKVYIFGHRNPDTDSVTAAITLSYLKRKLGMNAIPVVLSSITRETSYALNYFNVKEPMFLNDIKLKVKDLDYSKNYMVPRNTSIYESYKRMEKEEISKIPVVDKDKKILGIVSMTDIAKECLNGNYSKIESSYKNIMTCMDGEEILRFDNVIKGNLIIPGYRSSTFLNDIKLKKTDILITNNRYSIIEYAAMSKVKLIIITNGVDIKPEHIEIAKNNRVNIIRTRYQTLDAIKKINFCNDINTIINTTKVHIVNEEEDLSDFINEAIKTKYTYYPIVNKDKKCLGIIKFSDVGYHNKKKVILVDHNSYEQSVIGLNEADILEIIDHHNISNIGTTAPINFRNMPVGSTNTIIYLMYKENNIKIPRDMAGLMLSGILSDTLILNSPTTTNTDRDAVNTLARIAKVDYKQYGFDMISYGTKLINKTKEEILYTDYKKYPTEEGKIGLGQIYTTNIQEIEDERQEYIDMLNNISKNNEYKFVALFVTDIIKNGTYVYYSDEAEAILSRAFNAEMKQGYYLQGILSRKLQVLPAILNVMQ